MVKTPETAAKEIGDIAQAAYHKGWNDAIAAITEAAKSLAGSTAPASIVQPNQNIQRKKRRRGRRGDGQRLVLDIIKMRPGLTGVQIARPLAEGNGPSERAVRTYLRRLRLAGAIEQRDKKWYAKDSVQEAA